MRFVLTAIGLLFMACSPRPTSPAGVAKIAFGALQKGDWPAFVAVSLTFGEVMESDAGDESSRGAVRDRQLAALKHDFDRAVTGGVGQIDFKSSQLRGLGQSHGGVELTKSVHGEIFALKLKTPQGEIDSSALYPKLVLVPWQNEWRILSLVFPADDEDPQ